MSVAHSARTNTRGHHVSPAILGFLDLLSEGLSLDLCSGDDSVDDAEFYVLRFFS